MTKEHNFIINLLAITLLFLSLSTIFFMRQLAFQYNTDNAKNNKLSDFNIASEKTDVKNLSNSSSDLYQNNEPLNKNEPFYKNIKDSREEMMQQAQKNIDELKNKAEPLQSL